LLSRQKWRVILTAGLFFAWIGWLAYLAVTATRPIVLSRPQFLVSNLDVIAQVDQDKTGPIRKVTIEHIYWQQDKDLRLDDKISVTNLEACSGWQGPGHYILPLHHSADGTEVVLPGKSPGFPPTSSSELAPTVNRPRIYPVTPETLRQLESIETEKAIQPH
jgi:hypothetical protein